MGGFFSFPGSISARICCCFGIVKCAGTYLPKWVKIQKASETFDALTFIADPTHEDYLPPGDLKEIAMMVSKARGQRGTNLDYLRNTVETLHQLELKDSGLETILDLAKRKAGLHLSE